MRVLKRAREKIGEGGNGGRTKRKSAKRSEREREGKKGEEKKRRRASRASCHLRRTGGSLAYYATESVSLFPPFLFPSFSFGSTAFSPDGESFVPGVDSLR